MVPVERQSDDDSWPMGGDDLVPESHREVETSWAQEDRLSLTRSSSWKGADLFPEPHCEVETAEVQERRLSLTRLSSWKAVLVLEAVVEGDGTSRSWSESGSFPWARFGILNSQR